MSFVIPFDRLLKYLLYFSPFLFPFYLIRFSVIGIPFTLLELFTYFVFGIWLLFLLSKKTRLKFEGILRYYWIACFVLLIGATVGVLVVPHFMEMPTGEIIDTQRMSLGVWKGWLLAPILYFVVLTQTFKEHKDVKKFLRMIAYSGFAISMASYIMLPFGLGLTIDYRLNGFYESANYLALYLVPCLLILFHLVLCKQYPLNKWNYFDLIAFAVIGHAIAFTQSYAAIIGVFGATGLYLLLLAFKKSFDPKKSLITLLLLLSFFGILLTAAVNTAKFQNFLDFDNRSSTSVRMEIYKTSAKLIQDHPWSGIGPGVFQAYYQTESVKVLGKPPMEWNMPHPHNLVLAFWLNAGVLGLLALIMFFALSHSSFTYPLIALWGILIHGLFDVPFWKNDLAMLFFAILGSIAILQTYEIYFSTNRVRTIKRQPAKPSKKRTRKTKSSSKK